MFIDHSIKLDLASSSLLLYRASYTRHILVSTINDAFAVLFLFDFILNQYGPNSFNF